MDERVGADEEVRQNSAPRASRQTVRAVDPTRLDGHIAIIRNQADTQAVQPIRGKLWIVVGPDNVRPDRGGCDEGSLGGGLAQSGG